MPRGKTNAREFLLVDEARDLLNAPYKSNIRDRLILGLMLKCGLRAGELVASGRQHKEKDGTIKRWETLGLRRDDLILDETKQVAKLRVIGGKGSKDRYVPVPFDLAILYKKYAENIEPDKPIFDMSRQAIYWLVNRYAKRAGIKRNVYPHMLRHTFATQAGRAGWNPRILQEVLGHDSLETTQIYFDLIDTDMEEIHQTKKLPY